MILMINHLRRTTHMDSLRNPTISSGLTTEEASFSGAFVSSSTATTSAPTSRPSLPQQHQQTPLLQRLERCRQWLSDLPNDEARTMQNSPELRDFLDSFAHLEQAHRRSLGGMFEISLEDPGAALGISRNTSVSTASSRHPVTPTQSTASIRTGNTARTMSFLQQVATDEIILRVFDYLECRSLIRAMRSCTRFYRLSKRNAASRTTAFCFERQLTNSVQLLRAQEHLDGVDSSGLHHVRIPTLLLSRRIQVRNCGAEDFNGVYYCTGSNGNGYVFTKPRLPEIRVERARRMVFPDEVMPDPGLGRDVAQTGQLLRCIIAKRFSSQVRSRREKDYAHLASTSPSQHFNL